MLYPSHTARVTPKSTQAPVEATTSGASWSVPAGVHWLRMKSTDADFFVTSDPAAADESAGWPVAKGVADDIAVEPGTTLKFWTATGTANVRLWGVR